MATVNPWKRFIGLLPGGSRTVGRVISINNSTGTSTIELRNLTRVTAQGISVPINQQAFIVDGRVVGPAPALAQYQVEV